QLLKDLEKGEGWGTLCFSVQGMVDFQKEVREKGFSTSPIFDAQRKTPEGKILRWKMLFIDSPKRSALPYPFFIEWEESEKDRIQHLKTQGSITAKNEELEVKSCFLNSKNPIKDCQAWKKLLDIKSTKKQIFHLNDVTFHFVQAEEKKRVRLNKVIIDQR